MIFASGLVIMLPSLLLCVHREFFTFLPYYLQMDKSSYTERMQKVIDFFVQELAGIQAGRATKGLVEFIELDPGYGTKMPIGQLANITIADTQTLRIEPWDKSIVGKIEKAIYDAGTGLVPQNNGDYLYVKIPPLTTERRKELVKQVTAMGEETKVKIRQVRHDVMHDVKEMFDQKLLSEDEKKSREKEIDETTKSFVAKVDEIVEAKAEDIMKV